VLLRRCPSRITRKTSRLDFLGHWHRISDAACRKRHGRSARHVKDSAERTRGHAPTAIRQELSPHTDSCDLVGLLCLPTAGGRWCGHADQRHFGATNALLAHPDSRGALPRLCPPLPRAAANSLHALSHPVYSNVEGKYRRATCAPTSRQVKQRPGGRWARRNAPSLTRSRR